MSKREWTLFVEDILESIELIESYVEGMDFDHFSKDRKTIDAVVRNFAIIGEAAKHIPNNIKEKNPDVDWKGMEGFRNRIVHAYFDISLGVVWYIVKNELPPLKAQMKQMLGEKK
jgi:uncharacterized protein with HEPN domain